MVVIWHMPETMNPNPRRHPFKKVKRYSLKREESLKLLKMRKTKPTITNT